MGIEDLVILCLLNDIMYFGNEYVIKYSLLDFLYFFFFNFP